jgi:hypothetical protein
MKISPHPKIEPELTLMSGAPWPWPSVQSLFCAIDQPADPSHGTQKPSLLSSMPRLERHTRNEQRMNMGQNLEKAR